MADHLISNYGLYWKRKKIWWGKGGNRGHLSGVLASKTTGNPVDFRDQQGIYTLYDDTFRMVYAGQAGGGDNRLFDRLKQHTRDQLADRWTRFSWFGIRWVTKAHKLSAETVAAHVPLNITLNHMEALLLASVEPPHNRQGGRFGSKVEQYLQCDDEKALDDEQLLREVWTMLKDKEG